MLVQALPKVRDGFEGCSVAPFALTGPVFVDGDGGGGHDHPPFAPPVASGGGAAVAAEPASPERPGERRSLTPDEVLERWGAATGNLR